MVSRLVDELADAAAVHEQHGLRSAARPPGGELVGHDEDAPSAAAAAAAAAADGAVPCFSVPAEAGRRTSAGSVAQHVLSAPDDGHDPSPVDAAADGALLRAVPWRRPAATAAQVDVAF